jgi:hypothetical protein
MGSKFAEVFHLYSLIIPIAVLLPNFLFFVIQPRNSPENEHNQINPIFKIAEGVGRLGVFVLPIFSASHMDRKYEVLALIGMLVFLVFYYSCWIRYFIGNREYLLLFSPILGVPVPLAISPILYFCCASVILHSPLMFLSSLILAVGHIPASLKSID